MPSRVRLSVLLILAGAALSPGCAPLDHSIPESRLGVEQWNFIADLDVPVVRGTEGCGAQALAAVLAFHDARRGAAERAEALPWHDTGATPVDLLLAARDDGFAARVHAGDWARLEAAVDAGTPPLVMFDAAPVVPTLTGGIPTPPVMHWGVVSGVERNGERVLIANTARRHHPVAREDFLERWARADHCTIVVAAQVPRSGAK